MSWFRVKQKPEFTGLQLNTSVTTLPIPIVYGQNKLSPNVVWFANFQTQGGSGKGHVFASSSATITYTADILMALCEGPINGIGSIWKDQSVYGLSQLGLTFYNGSATQGVWGYLSSTYPDQALAYPGTAYVCAASYQLGQSADIGNHNFELFGVLSGSGANGVDADPAEVILDFLTNATYGAGFTADQINTASLLEQYSGDASLQAYCRAQGIAFSPVLSTQEQASSILTRWLQIVNCAAIWSTGQLKFVTYADTAIAAGNHATTTAATSVPQPAEGGSPEIVVCGASVFVSDGGVVYALRDAALSYVGGTSPGQGQYAILPSGTYIFNAADVGAAIQITYTYQLNTAFTPNLTPIYSLTDEDFLNLGGNNDPLTVEYVDVNTLPNILRVECSSRSNQYMTVPVEARDQSQIEEMGGPRVGSTITAHEICDELNIGALVAQTLLQRALYVRQKFSFRIGVEFCLLEPMDIVEVTDANLGLAAYPVRIVDIEEDEKGFKITAEQLTVGVSSPALYAGGAPSGSGVNRGVAAEPVNAPLIYEPPADLTNNVVQLWLGASGGSGGIADPNWGGANIYVSLDNSTYSQIGQITQPLRQGVLTATLADASGWDTSDTLAVNVTESGAELTGTSAASAQAGSTLALVDSELLAYESATLSSAGHYNLIGLQRGLYGSSPASHASGAPFARLDGAVFKWTIPTAYIGKTLYFKFQSINIFGQGLQSLAACTAYAYAVLGSGILMPANISGFGAALTLNGLTYVLAGQWTADPNSTGYIVQWSTPGSGAWNTIYAGASNNFTSPGWSYTPTLLLRVVGVNGAFQSPTWSQITVETGAETTVDLSNLGLYVQFNDLSAGLGDDLLLQQFQIADYQAMSMLDDALAAHKQTTALQVGANQANASLTEVLNVQVSQTAALAAETTSLNARFGPLAASFDDQIVTIVNSQQALTSEITTAQALSNAGTANGNVQMVAVSGSSGVAAAYEIQVSATGTGGSMQYAGLRMEALSGGTSQVVIEAGQFIVENGSTKTTVFATNTDGTLQLQGVTKVATAIKSLGTGANGQPYMTIDYTSSPKIIIDDGT